MPLDQGNARHGRRQKKMRGNDKRAGGPLATATTIMVVVLVTVVVKQGQPRRNVQKRERHQAAGRKEQRKELKDLRASEHRVV